MTTFPSSFERAANIIRKASIIKPGERFNVGFFEISDCEFPADPLTKQTLEWKIDFVKERLPFNVNVLFNHTQRLVIFERIPQRQPVALTFDQAITDYMEFNVSMPTRSDADAFEVQMDWQTAAGRKADFDI